jgi:DNA modification methylase
MGIESNIKCAYTKLVDPHELKPHPDNENVHREDQINALAKIIAKVGQRSPIVVSNRSGFMTKGHGTLQALFKLGWENVAVDYQDYESELEEFNHRVADNEIARYASLDENKFLGNLRDHDLDISTVDFEEFGLLEFELPEMEQLAPQGDDDAVPELKEDPITKRGDVWILGDHRILCGDSTLIDDVEKLMKGEKADMVFTDPPYGMNLNADYSSMNGGQSFDNIKGDHDDFSEDLINSIFYFNYVEEMFIFGADYFAEMIPNKNDGSWIVWDKRSDELTHGKLDKVFGSQFELCWSKSKHKREIARILRKFGYFANRENEKTVHPSQKPIKLVEWFFEKWCESLSRCVDLYLGSGSTLIACEKTNRKCYGMELDEHYCDVIINRWQDYTKKDAILESTGESYNNLKDGGEMPARCM